MIIYGHIWPYNNMTMYGHIGFMNHNRILRRSCRLALPFNHLHEGPDMDNITNLIKIPPTPLIRKPIFCPGSGPFLILYRKIRSKMTNNFPAQTLIFFLNGPYGHGHGCLAIMDYFWSSLALRWRSQGLF